MNITITLQDNLTPELARMRDALTHRRPLHAALAGHVARDLRAHFTKLERRGNKRGWPRRHFWNREGRQNTAVTEISDAGGTVTIASVAIAHKVMGGTIRAKRSKYLAIPVSREAYKAGSPREGRIFGLFALKGRLVAAKDKQGKKLITHYILKTSVFQRADPNALPPPADIEATVQRETESWLRAHAAK